MKLSFKIIAFFIITGFSSSGHTFPEEPASVSGPILFTIERSRDSDYLVYELNLKQDGKPDKSDPINIFWVMNSDNGRKEPLTPIQNKFGYGIDIQENKSEEEWEFSIVAVPDKTFTLKKESDRNFQVYFGTGKEEVKLEKIYIYFSNKSFWNPKISHLSIYGLNSISGNRTVEKISIKE